MRAVLLSIIALAAIGAARADGFPTLHGNKKAIEVAGLHAPAVVLRDTDGVPHIYALDEHDALFMQGFLQAQDRLFQLDVLRRTASGTLAELVGQGALPSDVELQTIGLRRAAERSLAAYSASARAGLQAYADGVNAWVQRNALPANYAALEVTKFEPWAALDSALIGKALAFQLSFDLDIDATLQYLEYQKKLIALNPQAGAQIADGLFFLDVFRSAPFDPAASVPDANGPRPRAHHDGKADGSRMRVDPAAAELLKQYRHRIDRIPFLKRTLSRTERQIGSNEWAVAGKLTRNGRPLVANDPHLSLDLPPNFYDLQITTLKDGLDAIGSSVAGTPWIVLGQNRFVTWGETTTGFDVTDTYQEQVVPDSQSPSGLATLFQGQLEPIIPVPLAFKVNLRDGGAPDTIVPVPPGGGIPPVALIVPRRNNGPIVQLDQATGVAISVQYAGFGGTRELETFRLLNRARNLADFKAALQFFDVGSQNFIYGDIAGNIGYFTTGEVPLREDLQAGIVRGAPPWFIRNGQAGNEWIRKAVPGPADGTGYEHLPFDELPQVVNPRSGFVVNANNDPAGVTLDNNPVNQLRKGGSGIYFLGYAFDFGTRAGRITQALREKLARGRVDSDDMQELQADVTLFDASVLAPHIVQAFANARADDAPAVLKAFAADPQIEEAVRRLARWDYTAPTGVATGYDAADQDGYLLPPKRKEVQASIAATIYSVWRGRAIANCVDRALQGLGVPTPGSGEAIKSLRHLVERDGIGLSTIDFFAWAALPDPAQRRDFVLLKSLRDALDLLSGPAFAAAFNGSTNQDEYRWGKLHRITFDGVILGGPFSIPGATPGFPPSFDGLPGIAVDGGFGVVDASSHSARSASASAFTFGSGPNRRYVGNPGVWPGSIDAVSILPGGNSGNLGDEFYANQLGRWLTNDTYPFRQQLGEVLHALDSREVYRPARAH
ncbi:MAG: penicillin acylase family protein [Steroidobacteraceae bacterium]